MAAYRIGRATPAVALFALVALIVVVAGGTGLGLAAARLQDGQAPRHTPIHKIVRPFDGSLPPKGLRDTVP